MQSSPSYGCHIFVICWAQIEDTEGSQLTTVKDALNVMAERVVGFVPSWHNPRFLGHDAIHCILDLYADYSPKNMPVARKIEEEVSIFQAVLMNDPKVSRGSIWGNGGHDVTLEDIFEKLQPGIGRFARKVGLSECEGLCPQEIEAVYRQAVMLKEAFREVLGREFADIGLEELLTMDVDPLRNVVTQVRAEAAAGKWQQGVRSIGPDAPESAIGR